MMKKIISERVVFNQPSHDDLTFSSSSLSKPVESQSQNLLTSDNDLNSGESKSKHLNIDQTSVDEIQAIDEKVEEHNYDSDLQEEVCDEENQSFGRDTQIEELQSNILNGYTSKVETYWPQAFEH